MMKRIHILFLLLTCFSAAYCQTTPADQQAADIARKTVNAMGGLQNFKNVNYLGWNFFGYRQIIWDKVHDRVRIDYLKKKITIIADLNRDSCILYMNDERVTQPDSLAKYLKKGRSIWMNDSYWLIMPFKLFDSGVNLTYTGKGLTTDSTEAHILELTFNNVGETPENKYLVYIDTASYYVIQWDYYSETGHMQPELTNTWGDYKKYGKIYLSGDRGERGKLSDIHVWSSLPDSVFSVMRIKPVTEL